MRFSSAITLTALAAGLGLAQPKPQAQDEDYAKLVNLEQFDVQAEIVGVVGHIKQWGRGTDQKSAVEAQFFYPFMQLPEKLMPLAAGAVAVVLRTAGDPAAVMGPVRRAVEQLDSRDVFTTSQRWTKSSPGRSPRAGSR